MKHFTLLATSLLVSSAWPSAVIAASIEGVQFAERLNVGATEFRLHATGLLRYRVFIKGYVAALYLEKPFREQPNPRSVLADTPRRLEIEYFWSFDAEDFSKATLEGIARNTDPAGFERLRPSIDQISALYKDIEPGDRYALTYVPGVGTELARNGRSLGVIEGAEFSAALFAIWIGDRPLDESLRDQLLASY